MAETEDRDGVRAEYEAKFNALSDDHAASLREHAVTIGELQERLSTNNIRLSKMEGALKAERAAHDETRGELLDALLQIERLRGYLNAVQDLRPPRMVEEDRELKGAERRETYARERRFSDPPAKRFFERGA